MTKVRIKIHVSWEQIAYLKNDPSGTLLKSTSVLRSQYLEDPADFSFKNL